MRISRIFMLYMNCIGCFLSRIMNPQETEQIIARDELWVPTAERVNISTTNVRLETTVKQKEETFQVVIDVIKNSTCIKAFTISADVPEILMQQFWYTITKIKGSESYEFLLADKRCVIDAEVFRKILDICPRKEESVPEPAKRILSDIAISETTQKLKGIQTLSPAEQEAADIMKALKDSRRMLRRQPGTGGSDEGTGEIPGVPDESIYADAEDENEETESDSNDIYMYRINVRKNADTEMKAAEKNADITKETTEQPLTSSSLSIS
ncbi:hypothetical protein Tco_0085240 [Tanacetum coccineum]